MVFDMKRLSLLCAAVLLGAGALPGVATIPAAAAPRDSAGVGANAEAEPAVWSVGTVFNLHRVSLVNGQQRDGVKKGETWTVEKLSGTIDRPGDGFKVTDSANRPTIDYSVKWQAKIHGETTSYWIVSRVVKYWDFYWSNTRGTCDVYRGDPDHGGVVAEGPVICEATMSDRTEEQSKVTFDVRLNRLAEASGTIKTTGSLSLAQGEYTPSSKLHLAGASAVAENSSTPFDSILAPGYEEGKDTARMMFKYALLDNGQEVFMDGKRLYIAGHVLNQRDWAMFWGHSDCAVVDDQYRGIENSGYSCDTNGYYANTDIRDGRVHYIADFTVKKVT